METKEESKTLSSGSSAIFEAIPVIEAVPLTDNSDPEGTTNAPMAFALEDYTSSNDPESKSYETVMNTRLGTDIGKVKTWQEKDTILTTSKHARSKSRQEEESVRIANAIAKTRNREGFDIKEDKYHSVQDYVLKKVEREEQKFSGNATKQHNTAKGYETKEYDVTEYEGKKEYHVSEYTSIYDR